MNRLLLAATIGLTLASASAYGGTVRDHSKGAPEGGVTVGTPTGKRGGGEIRPVKTTVKPAPRVEHPKNWGIQPPGNTSTTFPPNLNDHRGVCRTC